MAADDIQTIFQWVGNNDQGKMVEGEIEASNIIAVKLQLKKQGIKPKTIKKKRKPLFFSNNRKKIKSGDIAALSRQISTMINAGIRITQTLEIVGKGNENENIQELIGSVKDDIETGSNFSEALRKHPKHFNSLFCNLVHAGEQSGSLDIMLKKIAEYQEKSESIRSKIKKALSYPISVIVISLLITSGLMLFIVPKFETMFNGLGADLPLPTQIVVDLSDFFQAYWFILFPSIVFGIWFFFYSRRTFTKFAYFCDRLSLRIPVFGNILRKATIARFARTLSITFAAGLPLVEALRAVSGAAGNRLYVDACLQIAEEVKTGQTIQSALKETKLFPNMVVQMVAIGEEAGSLELMLNKVADFFEQEVDDAVDSLSSLLEPMIMIVIGGLIGGTVMAMYLPIFKLGSVL